MNAFILSALIAFGAYWVKARYQRQRILLLGSHLSQFQIEKLMEDLTQGYMRALGETDTARQEQIWSLMGNAETKLCDQFKRFVADFSKLGADVTRISTLPMTLPYAEQLFPQATFDLRKVLQIHAQGLDNAAANATQRNPKERAYVMLAELMLMQHSCHWFCRSKTVASARMVMRHQTAYAQVLGAVAPETRKAYVAVVGD